MSPVLRFGNDGHLDKIESRRRANDGPSVLTEANAEVVEMILVTFASGDRTSFDPVDGGLTLEATAGERAEQ
jgi:hypothetical protein